MVAFFVTILSFAAALMVEWGMHGVAPSWAVPPLAAFVCVTAFLYVPFSLRMTIALAAGILLDAFSLFPTGTYVLALSVLAVIAEFLGPFFRLMNRSLALPFGGGVLAAAYIFLVLLSAYGLELVFRLPLSAGTDWTGPGATSLKASVFVYVVWAALYPIVCFGLFRVFGAPVRDTI